jgi:hypothetical protein
MLENSRMRDRLFVTLFAVALLAVAAAGAVLDTTAFFASMFAVLVTAGAVLFTERTLRPQLRIDVEAVRPVLPDGRVFLRLEVENAPTRWPLSIFLDRRPALFTRAWITFLREDGQPVFRPGHRMIGRWSGTPEPKIIAIRDAETDGDPIGYIRDVSGLQDTIDIPPGERATLDLVMRPPDNDECLGWHNGIIGKPVEPERGDDDLFNLRPGRYQAVVEVQTGGRAARAAFRIVNDVPINHFRLESIRRV